MIKAGSNFRYEWERDMIDGDDYEIGEGMASTVAQAISQSVRAASVMLKPGALRGGIWKKQGINPTILKNRVGDYNLILTLYID